VDIESTGELRRDGAIKTARGRIIILDEYALRNALMDN